MKSMTGYAALDLPGRRWDLRSVNARGFDLRLRLPDVPELEPMVRAALAGVVTRGNVTLSLRLGDAGGAALPQLNTAALEQAMAALNRVRTAATEAGLDLVPDRASDLLLLPGVYAASGSAEPPRAEDLRGDIARLVADFDASRVEEGAGLRRVLTEQIEEIDALRARADALSDARSDHMAQTFRTAVARLGETDLDPDRLLPEIAALAVKADIAEELDRLTLHVVAARKLIAAGGAVGRKLDFLTQEFNREANTLCSKANMAEVTAIGLDMKAAIDRLREQVQNVE